MKVSIKMNEDDIRTILARHISQNYSINVLSKDLHIEVKSKQNYRSEWEIADIRLEQELTL